MMWWPQLSKKKKKKKNGVALHSLWLVESISWTLAQIPATPNGFESKIKKSFRSNSQCDDVFTKWRKAEMRDSFCVSAPCENLLLVR